MSYDGNVIIANCRYMFIHRAGAIGSWLSVCDLAHPVGESHHHLNHLLHRPNDKICTPQHDSFSAV